VREVLERVGEAMAESAADLRGYVDERRAFADVGQRMPQARSEGAVASLGLKTGFGRQPA
jgi:hypothetical protein